MKKICTFLSAALLCATANAQLVINEIYTDPGNNKHEFFELYNTGLEKESANNYTLVTYSTSSTYGPMFLVLDLPKKDVAGRGFFVGSAADPLNYQSNTGSKKTSLNWNNKNWMESNEASLTAWTRSTNNLTDGNPAYDEVAVPAGFNNLFDRLSGNGSSYVVFLYKNGVLVNSLIAGSGGQTTLPSEVLAMPMLHITMTGSAPAFSINFGSYATLPVEAINQDAGSDNGFIRDYDGACRSWKKSSSQVSHTPEVTNGKQSTTSGGNILSTATVLRGTSATGSTITYKIASAATSELPAQVALYIDNGSVDGELDANDQLLVNQNITTVGTVYQQVFNPYDENILVVTRNSAGCIDNMRLATSSPVAAPLPVYLTAFSASVEGARSRLVWSVGQNEDGSHFEVQSSTNGKDFKVAAVVFTNDRAGQQTYTYTDAKELAVATYFRLKLVNKDGSHTYSKTVYLKSGAAADQNTLTLLQNPVGASLTFNYATQTSGPATVNVYNNSGAKMQSFGLVLNRGVNLASQTLNSTLKPGLYLVEVVSETERTTAKFIKQ